MHLIRLLVLLLAAHAAHTAGADRLAVLALERFDFQEVGIAERLVVTPVGLGIPGPDRPRDEIAHFDADVLEAQFVVAQRVGGGGAALAEGDLYRLAAGDLVLHAERVETEIVRHLEIERNLFERVHFVVTARERNLDFRRAVAVHGDGIPFGKFVFLALAIDKLNTVRIVLRHGDRHAPARPVEPLERVRLPAFQNQLRGLHGLVRVHLDIDVRAFHSGDIAAVGHFARRELQVPGIVVGEVDAVDRRRQPGGDLVSLGPFAAVLHLVFHVLLDIDELVVIHALAAARARGQFLPRTARRPPAHDHFAIGLGRAHPNHLVVADAHAHVAGLNREGQRGHLRARGRHDERKRRQPDVGEQIEENDGRNAHRRGGVSQVPRGPRVDEIGDRDLPDALEGLLEETFREPVRDAFLFVQRQIDGARDAVFEFRMLLVDELRDLLDVDRLAPDGDRGGDCAQEQREHIRYAENEPGRRVRPREPHRHREQPGQSERDPAVAACCAHPLPAADLLRDVFDAPPHFGMDRVQRTAHKSSLLVAVPRAARKNPPREPRRRCVARSTGSYTNTP